MPAGVFECDAEYDSFRGITGIDEAGRGCLAGPVVVAAITWNCRQASKQAWFPSLADSKQLGEETREKLFPKIVEHGSRIKVAVIGAPLIDVLNILKATLHGFELVAPPLDMNCPLLIDGNQKPASLKYARTVIKGDSRVSAVAAAGIVAKVTRDRLMVELSRTAPQYGFQIHKGYATKAHRDAIKEHGPCSWHRKSFRPVSTYDRDSSPADAELENPHLSPMERWSHLRADYHRFSREACRRTIEQCSRQGLGLLPSVHDPICRH